MTITKLRKLIIILFCFTASMGIAKEYIVYSIVQNISMGHPGEEIKKNYYINMGQKQGVQRGAQLNVFRTLSRLDPYQTKKRYSYQVKIGEIEVLHSQDNSSIGRLVSMNLDGKEPLIEIEGVMIGDQVGVKIK
jgi:hypothetical protein